VYGSLRFKSSVHFTLAVSVGVYISFFLEYAGDLRIIIFRRKSLKYNQRATSALGGQKLDRPSKGFVNQYYINGSTKNTQTSRPTSHPGRARTRAR